MQQTHVGIASQGPTQGVLTGSPTNHEYVHGWRL